MKILSQDSYLKSISTCKCPRCHDGDMFESVNLKKLSSFFEMKKSCEVCQQSFEPEPGYYFGAMFISYALNTALFIAIWVGLELFYSEYTLTLLLSLISLSAILLLPLFFRISRSLWIAIFIPYRAKEIQKEL